MKPNYQIGDQIYEVSPLRAADQLLLNIAGNVHRITLNRDCNPQTLELDGKSYELYVVTNGDDIFVQLDGRQWQVTSINPIDAVAARAGGSNRLLAPMPGVVVSVNVSVGDAISEGQTLLTIESMKLQTAIVADRDGLIAEIGFAEGDTFDKGATLVCFEDEADDE